MLFGSEQSESRGHFYEIFLHSLGAPKLRVHLVLTGKASCDYTMCPHLQAFTSHLL